MSKKKVVQLEEKTEQQKFIPAMTPQGREDQLISLAYDAAETQIRNGTASSQVITHFLRLGTEREKKEREKLEMEIELLKTKKQTLEDISLSKELYEEAINSIKIYTGGDDNDNNGF